MKTLIGYVVNLFVLMRQPGDERGLSQSTENAVLLTGAVVVAGLVVAAVTAFVKNNMPS